MGKNRDDLHAVKAWRSHESRTPLLAVPSALDAEYSRAPDLDSSLDNPCENGLFVVSVCGPIEHHGADYWSWFESFDRIERVVCKALDRSDVRAVILKIDSPGGVANGMASTSRAIRNISPS